MADWVKIIESQGAKSDAYGLAIKTLKRQSKEETYQSKQTNYDRIRGMSLAELAIFLSDTADCDGCPARQGNTFGGCKACASAFLTWLASE